MIEDYEVVTYVDHSKDTPNPERRDRAKTWFLNRLYKMLEDADATSSIISWQPHGRSFVIHDNKKLQAILPNYFKITKTSSFLRQLNIYGFTRILHGPDGGGYYHERFLHGMRWLAQTITPFKVKGTGIRQKSKPHPDFSIMEWVVPALQEDGNDQMPSSTAQEDTNPSMSTIPRSCSVVSNEDDLWMTSALNMTHPDSTKSNNFIDTTPLMEELVSGVFRNDPLAAIVDHIDYSKIIDESDWHWEADEVQSAMYDLVHEPAGISFDRFLQDLAVEARM